tara:strand:- start:1358 stop:2422 length:1065 start_codon:yes stop_codon:yes gene_type:complete
MALATGRWWHVVATVSSGTVQFYVNGTAKTSSSGITITGTTQDLIIGATPSYNFFNGHIDEAAIFNSALSASDVVSIYNNGNPADLSSYNPVGWWRMGDGTEAGSGTTVYDMSSNSNNATLTNGPTYSSDVPAFSSSSSIDFDGTNDYMDIGSSGDMGSWSLWFKPDSTITTGTTGQYLLSFSANGSVYGNLGLGSSTGSFTNEVLTFNQGNRAYGYAGSGLTINTDWHHVAGRWTGSTYEFYLDGTQVKNTEGGSGAAGQVAFSALKVGGLGAASNFAGLIDEVAVFTSPLSASDIVAIYNSGTPADLTSYSPLGWWRMGEANGDGGTTISDQGSGGNNGTLTNGPTFSTDVP